MPRIGGRVIFRPVVLDFGLRERVGLPFFPAPSFGFRVGFKPEGGRVSPPVGAEGAVGTTGGGDGGADGASSGAGGDGSDSAICSSSGIEASTSAAGAGGGRSVAGGGGGRGLSFSSSPKEGEGKGGELSSDESPLASRGAEEKLGSGGKTSSAESTPSSITGGGGVSERGGGVKSTGGGRTDSFSSSPNDGKGGGGRLAYIVISRFIIRVKWSGCKFRKWGQKIVRFFLVCIV